VLAQCGLIFGLDAFPTLRRQPGPGDPLPANLLKHADEQTVVALAAVREASRAPALSAGSFENWGIVAAPAFIGRSMLAASLQRFAIEGAWGMSPHFIPHRTQHSVSGTISQVLKVHGPNCGSGGGPMDAGQALLCAAVLLETERLPGVWVVLTGWEPEFIPGAEAAHEPVCQGVALALCPVAPGRRSLKLVLQPSAARPGPTRPANLPDFCLASLLRFVRASPREQAGEAWSISGWGEIAISHGETGRILPPPRSFDWGTGRREHCAAGQRWTGKENEC
jgi:hypothetical protein